VEGREEKPEFDCVLEEKFHPSAKSVLRADEEEEEEVEELESAKKKKKTLRN
jgi:hypothetical protein